MVLEGQYKSTDDITPNTSHPHTRSPPAASQDASTFGEFVDQWQAVAAVPCLSSIAATPMVSEPAAALLARARFHTKTLPFTEAAAANSAVGLRQARE